MLIRSRSKFSALARIFVLTLLFASGRFVGADGITPDQERFFEERVRPVLAEHCLKCHGPTKQESDLRLDSRSGFLATAASGEVAIVPGKPEESPLLKAVRKQGDVKMPPEGQLSEEQIASLSEWIKSGAPWPSSPSPGPNVLSAKDRAAVHGREHWAYQPVREPPPAEVKNVGWIRNTIDRHVLAGLEAKNIGPSPEADRHTLARRLSFDLIGLPPTFAEVEAFANDASPEAYERYVDALLASPQYGERWGRHWLDVARYADSRGYLLDRERRYPYAYTYRDYVVRAFNEDLAYDRFLREQLAADQLPGGDSSSLAALGFITVGRKYGSVHDTYDDQIDAVTRGMLGLTVACARCHDHKYDAVPTDDYYSLYGIFAGCKEPETDELPLIGDPATMAGYQEFKAELDKRTGELNAFADQLSGVMTQETRERVTDYLARAAVDSNDDFFSKLSFLSGKPDLRKRMVDRWRDYLRRVAKPENATLGFWAEAVAIPDGEFAAKIDGIVAAWRGRSPGLAAGQANPQLLAILEKSPPKQKVEVARIYGELFRTAWEAWKAAGANEEAIGKLPEDLREAAGCIAGKDSPTTVRREDVEDLLRRDERNRYRDIKKKVDQYLVDARSAPPRAMIVKDNPQPFQPRVFIRGNNNRPGKEVPRQMLLVSAGPDRKPFQKGSGRLELAEAIASPENPLTRRVMVNRVWMNHFGEPLVDSPSDFGIRTAKPVQAALLDHLAAFLLDEGWSIKSLHRHILLSATYRQSSHDRAECKAVDPENRLLWRMNRRRLEWETLRDSLLFASGRLDPQVGGRAVDITKSPYSTRRTIYGALDRQDLPNLFRVFDIASPDQSTPKRARTTIPQQSLFLMNSPFVAEQSQGLANRGHDAGGNDFDARLIAMYRAALSREPSVEEKEIARRFLDGATATPYDAKLSPWDQLGQILLMTNEFAYVD